MMWRSHYLIATAGVSLKRAVGTRCIENVEKTEVDEKERGKSGNSEV